MTRPVGPAADRTERGAPEGREDPRAPFRFPEIPINVWGFLLLVPYLEWRGVSVTSVALLACLGLFCVWTETAHLERRLGFLSRALSRKPREDDLLPFVGALGGIAVAGVTQFSSNLVRGIAVPLFMAAGANASVLLFSRDWRRSVLAALMVVDSGTGGAVLRISVTLSVWILVLR